jgi:hypothetical protein
MWPPTGGVSASYFFSGGSASVRKKGGVGETYSKSLSVLAGEVGIEPTNAGIKIRCLTTWRLPKGNRSRFEISGCREAPQRMVVERSRHKPGATRTRHPRQRLQCGTFSGKRGEDATSGARHADLHCAGRFA